MAVARMVQYIYTSSHDNEDTEELKNLQLPLEPMQPRRPILLPRFQPPLAPVEATVFVDKPSRQLINYAHMYAFAIRYMIDDLKNLAFLKLKSIVSEHACSGDFLEKIRVVYDETPNDDKHMYPLMVQVAAYHRTELLFQDYFPGFILEIPQFNVDILKYVDENIHHHANAANIFTPICHICSEVWKCPSCEHHTFH